MPMTTLQFDLATPDALKLSEAVDMVEVPGEGGDFGVLPGHAPFMSIIRPGVVTVHRDGKAERFFVTAGYAEVNPQGCIVLAEHLYDLAKTTKEEAMTKRDDALRQLDSAIDELEKTRLERQLNTFEALVEAVI